MPPSDPEERIIECIDASLQVFGESVKHVIYYYLEKDFQLQKNEIPEKPEVFRQAITSIFGEEGSKIIEELIAQKMKQAFKLRQTSSLTFVDVVQVVKTR